VAATWTLAIAGTGALLYGISHDSAVGASDPPTVVDANRSSDTAVSRSENRTAAAPGPATLPSASPPPSPRPSQPGPAHRRPVAGLDQAQMDNAAAIVAAGVRRGLPQRAMVIAVATAMQESNLYIQANPTVPASLHYPHQRASADHDSLGLFQQRPSQGWGSVAQLMDPAYSAGHFYDKLVKVAGWQTMELTAAAQAVQRSAFPGAYQKHQLRAQQIVAALS
jgi:hypothetical protein